MLLTASKTIICLLHLLSILSYALSQVFVDEKMVLACAASNNTASNTFISNLNSLFNQKLHSEAGKSLYSNATEGEFPYTVYGLYLCKFNISFQSCQRCIVAAVNAVLQKCDGTKDAIIWYQVQECLVRFSDHSLPVTDTSLPLCMQGVQNSSVPVPDNFTKSLIQSFNDVVATPSLSSFSNATKETKISSIITLQSFGQCIPAMSKEDCRICLNETINLIPKCFVPRGTGFGRVLFPSCFMGFELYQFSKVPAVGAQGPISSSRGKRRGAALIAIGTTLSVVIVALFGSFLWYRWRRNKRDQEEKTNSQEVQILHWEGRIGNDHSYDILRGMPTKSQEFPLFPLGLVLEATKHFSVENKLGEGGFGPVYKGTLADGKDVAVKRLSRTSGQGLREFKNEVCLIAKLQHKNLVRLLGCCLEGHELLLIYEYMPNKSLDFLLFDSTMSGQLNWEKRMGIINGIARGILYLHEDSRLRIIHRDLKASNVLLDHEMNPKISDFGMARLFVGNQNEANTNRVVGTYGYMAPEYAMEGLFSIKSDVFSFGVLLLEIISGRKNTKFYLSEHGQSLLNYTWKLWCEGHTVELMDPVLKQSCITDEVLKCIHIGLLCVQEDPADRPTMSSVVVMLASDSMILPQPTQPAFSIGRVVKYGQFLPYTKECSVNEVTFSNVLPR